jgi:ACR3 family arsenite efflux pump ArsB
MFNKMRFFWDVIYVISTLCFLSGFIFMVLFSSEFTQENQVGISNVNLLQSIQNLWLMYATVALIDLLFFRFTVKNK